MSNRPTVPRSAALALALVCVAVVVLGSDARTASLFRNSIVLAVGAAAIALPVGTLLAVLLVRTNLPFRRTALWLISVQMFTPLYLQAAAWQSTFSKLGQWRGLPTGLATRFVDGWFAATWIHGLAAIPWVVLIVGIGLLTIEPELEESALLVTSRLRVLSIVTGRRAFPFLAAAFMWVSISVIGEMTVTDLFKVRTYAEQVYLLYALGDDSLLAGVEATSGILLVAILGFVAMSVERHVWPPPRIGGRRSLTPLGLAFRWPFVLFASFVVVLVLGVPIVTLVHELGMHSEVRAGLVNRSWTLSHARTILSTVWAENYDEILTTGMLTLIVATLNLALAIPLAWLTRRGKMSHTLVCMAALSMFSIPGPVVGSSLIRVFNVTNVEVIGWIYERTILPTCLALMLRSCPLAILILVAAFRSFPQEQIDRGRLDGMGSMKMLLSVVAPQRRTAIGCAWLLSAVLTFGDVSASVLVVPPGMSTVPLRVFGLLHSGVTDKVAGLCLTSLAFCTVFAGAIALFLRESPFSSRHSGEPR